MGQLEGVPYGVGEFPVNLVGKAMKECQAAGYPYPEEVCVFYNELKAAIRAEMGYKLKDLSTHQEALRQLGIELKDSPPIYQYQWLAEQEKKRREEELKVTLRDKPFDWSSVPVSREENAEYPKADPRFSAQTVAGFIAQGSNLPARWKDRPCNCDICTSMTEYTADRTGRWGKGKRYSDKELDEYELWYREDCDCPPCEAFRERLNAREAEESAEQTEPLTLTPPNPPRIGRLQVKETTNGEDTIHVLNLPFVLLKADGDWKYDDTVTISEDDIPQYIEELVNVQYRISQRRNGR